MSFYLNDFKKHLKGLADNVDHPYDEPISRQKNYTSIEETYSAMNQPRMGSFQRPAPSMLNEQAQQTSGTVLYPGPGEDGNGWTITRYGIAPNVYYVVTSPSGLEYKYKDYDSAFGFVSDRRGQNAQRANRDYPLPWRPNRKGDSFSNVQMRKDSPQLGGGFGGIGGGGG